MHIPTLTEFIFIFRVKEQLLVLFYSSLIPYNYCMMCVQHFKYQRFKKKHGTNCLRIIYLDALISDLKYLLVNLN